MAINTNYALITSGTWRVPAGVSSITVECFGSTKGYNSGVFDSFLQAARSGASYSKSTNIAVTEGQIFYHNNATDGGVTWFNSVNSQPVVGVDTPATSCLAVGGETTSTSQVAANIGDVKIAGGAGFATTGNILSGTGGSAGPNGAGAAAAGQYSNTTYNGYRVGTGGGANGGSTGGLGVIPYGRTGSGVTPGPGNGNYWTGSSEIGATVDPTAQSSYQGITPRNSTEGYGASGGATVFYRGFSSGPCCCYYLFTLASLTGVIVITLNNPTQLSIVFQPGTAPGNFVVPSNFVSLVSIEAVGVGGGFSSGSGGSSGGAYSKTNGSSITTPIVAGSTNVYYTVDGSGSWLRIGTLAAPTSTTDGVLAQAGSGATSSVGASGGQASSGVGDVKFSGGNGGQGFVGSTYGVGGAGGAAGPNSAGGNGGAAYLLAQNQGGGGGGATNNTEAGQDGTTSAGGRGANGLGTGGAGGLPPYSNGQPGANGGGGGGAFWFSSPGQLGPPLIINSIYGLRNSGARGGGTGTVAFTYSLVSGGANTSNFFQFF